MWALQKTKKWIKHPDRNIFGDNEIDETSYWGLLWNGTYGKDLLPRWGKECGQITIRKYIIVQNRWKWSGIEPGSGQAGDSQEH